MAETIQLVGALALAAVLLFLVVHGVVVRLRSRGRKYKKDDGNDALYAGHDSGDWGGGDSV